MTLTKELMSYKQQRKESELLIKLRIIRDVIVSNTKKIDVANKFSMHRNTVSNIIKSFNKRISKDTKHKIIDLDSSFSNEEINDMLSSLKNNSTKPISNKRSASKEQEDLIKSYFEGDNNEDSNNKNGLKGLKYGYRRMHMFVKRISHNADLDDKRSSNKISSLSKVTSSQVRGIYKRNKFRVSKVRSYNGTSNPLYDYGSLACFENMHYDTKTITDKKALPEDIYKKFSINKNIPIIEWNLIDVKTRFRFIAYSHARTSDFGLNFLISCIQYIRSIGVLMDQKITIGTDRGSEFFSGSDRKKLEWNKNLSVLNASIYSYESKFDTRKNLIERSHRTDDEEFFVPRGRFIKGKKTFLHEAENYFKYFNSLRPHTGIGMNGVTPLEKLKLSGIHNAEKLMNFPTMILEDCIDVIKQATLIVKIATCLNEYKNRFKKLKFDPKTLRDIINKFNLFEENAQNVLTHYLSILVFS